MHPSLPTTASPAAAAFDESDLVRLLTPDGRRVEHPDATWTGSEDDLLALHRDMVLTRRIDTEGYALQRHGELGLWPPSLGQEAVQVGTANFAEPIASTRLLDALPAALAEIGATSMADVIGTLVTPQSAACPQPAGSPHDA